MANILIIATILLIFSKSIQSTKIDDYEDDDCICVPLHHCQDFSGAQPEVEWRSFGDPENTNTCGNLLKTCCYKENLLNITEEPLKNISTTFEIIGEGRTSSNSSISRSNTTETNSTHFYEEVTHHPTHEVPSSENLAEEENRLKREPFMTCGYTNPIGLTFTLRNMNYETQYAEFPWMIQILEKKQTNVFTKSIFEYSAGGSLVHPSFVLTGAHKVFNVSLENLKIRAGDWDKTSEDEPYEHQERAVARIIIHHRYSNLYNSIALLFLESPLVLDKHVNTICIPPKNFMFYNDDCIVTGWGQDAVTKVTKNVLKKIEVPMVQKNECERLLRLTTLGPTFNRHANWICAGGVKGEDACFGDGGSPLVCPMADGVDRYYQAGIVVGGVGCGNENVPGLYVEVAKFTHWINRTIFNNLYPTTVQAT